MTEWGTMEDELEHDLARLAGNVPFPPTPDFAIPNAGTAGHRPARIGPDRWWMAGLAATLILLVTAVVIPPSRDALADWLGFPGIRIEIGNRDDDPPPTVTSIGGSLLLGEPVTLDRAREAARFELVMPGGELGQTAPEVYLNEALPGGQIISFLYPASGSLPAIGTTGVGLLLMQVDAANDTDIMIAKRASAESPLLPVTVDGANGLWIKGGVLMTDAGDPFWTYLRRSGNVLVWERGGVTYRLECSLPLNDALAIAESLQPIDRDS